MRKIFWLQMILVSLLFNSCSQLDPLDDIDGLTYNTEYAIPIMNSEISIQDLLQEYEDDNTLIIDPDGGLRFQYSGNVLRANVDQVFETINDALPPAIPIVESGSALPLSSPDGITIDIMDLKAGKFGYFFDSRNTEDIEVVITMPQITKGGQPLTITESLPAYSGVGKTPVATNEDNPLSLEGYTLLPLNDSLYVDYTVKTASGGEGNIELIFLTIEDIEFSYTEGFFGTLPFEGERDTIEIDFFDNYVKGDIYFSDPTVTFNVQNSFGIPTRSLINVLDVFTVNGEKLPLESSFIETGFDFPFPKLNEVGQVKSEPFVFNKSNSNIDVILGAGPTAFDYDVDAISNPDGNQGFRGFVTDSSFYNVRVDVDLPLNVTVRDFVANDTIDLDFNNIEDVIRAEFKVVSENNIPLDASIQGYFVGINGNIVDSLFTEQTLIVEAAAIDVLGSSIIESAKKEVFVPFNENRFPSIRDAKQLILDVSFSSTDNGNIPVRINQSQNILVKVGAKLGVSK